MTKRKQLSPCYTTCISKLPEVKARTKQVEKWLLVRLQF
ncbi:MULTISPECIES: DUF4113 domain-containing protein [Aeromonas]|nr:DUF4113 domain-containing protein [Aeromonas caviae]